MVIFFNKMARASTDKNEPKQSFSESENQVPQWVLASQGIKLIVNNNSDEAQKLFLKYPESLVMFAGYSFAVFMDALMSFEEEKLHIAISTLKEVEKRCATESGWLKHVTSKVFGGEVKPPRSLADQLETQIILADSQVCIAILSFLQQDISSYFKAGWVLRKAWKVYQKAYKEILGFYRERIGELQLPDPDQILLTSTDNPLDMQGASGPEWEIPETQTNGYIQKSKIPHSKSAFLPKTTNENDFVRPNTSKSSVNHINSSSNHVDSGKSNSFLKKSSSTYSALSNHSNTESFWSSRLTPFSSSLSFYSFPSSFNLFSSQENVKNEVLQKEEIVRLMGAVCFGYGLFQLGISFLPPSLMRLTNILGFSANRNRGMSCLMYARLGEDMRAPLARLSLLWYHTIVRPFYAIDGANIQAGVDASSQLLKESEEEFAESALFLFFKGRVCRLNSDITCAIESFQQAVHNATQREIKLLSLHEVGWCHLIELNYRAAEHTFLYLHSSSRWSKSFYAYLSTICTGATGNESQFRLLEHLNQGITGVPKGGQLEEFLVRRIKCCPPESVEVSRKQSVYYKLLVFEMLYLWNALPSCRTENLDKIVADCHLVTDRRDEPMLGLSKLILGCTYCVLKHYEEGILSFNTCLEERKNCPPNAEDAHISAFAQYELGALLLKSEETKPEGKLLLQQISQYSKYDFEHKLNVRVFSLLKVA